MLTISTLQLNAFQQAAIDRFVTETRGDLQDQYGPLATVFSEPVIDATIRYGIERARRYGIVGRLDVYLYVQCMFTLLGSDFDEDPQYPWAASTLQETYYPPNDRIIRLANRANAILTNIEQEEPDYLIRVRHAVQQNRYTALPGCMATPVIAQAVLSEAERFFPGKIACVGIENVNALIDHGVDKARSRSFDRGRDVAAFIQFMLIFGVNFDGDPKHPEARRIFSDPTRTAPQKIDAMFAAAQEFLDREIHALDHFEDRL